MPADPLGAALLMLARHAITAHLGQPQPPLVPSPAPELAAPGASFVTLTQGGTLRGCIGSLQAHRPLADDVAANAVAAAFRDPRFPPLTVAELPVTRLEVSLLAPAEPLPCVDEADALARLRPGIDGLVLSCGAQRATFLPQVWESLPQARDFLARLKQKAGLPADYWSPQLRLERYTVRKWKEEATAHVGTGRIGNHASP